MEKLLKNTHWLIILYAIYGIGMYAYESEERITETNEREAVQRERIVKAKKLKKEIQNFFRDIDEAKARIERVAVEIEKAQQLLPSEISDNDNISLLRKIVEDVNIKEVSISPEKDEDRGFYIARKYRFKAKATYLQFIIIFEKILEYKRILNVSELAFKKLDQPQRSKYQLIDGEFILEAYKYNSNFKEDRGIEQIEKNFDQSKEPSKNKPARTKRTAGGEEAM